MMNEFPVLLQSAKVKELLELHAAILEELRKRNIVRSSNQPLGDYAELLISRTFNWTLEDNSSSGHDATDSASGLRYQVKSRRITTHNGSRQLSFIRRLPDRTFDFLAGVLFNADYSVLRAAIVPHSLLEPRCRFSKHANGWLFKLEEGVWSLPGVRDVTNEVKESCEEAVVAPRSYGLARLGDRPSGNARHAALHLLAGDRSHACGRDDRARGFARLARWRWPVTGERATGA